MLTLSTFIFLSGVITVLSPCIWPILPVILSVTTTSGRYRPFGLVTGIGLVFMFTTGTFSAVLTLLPIQHATLRSLGIFIIVIFAGTLLIPAWERIFDRLVHKLTVWGGAFLGVERHGFWGGLVLGTALGLVWSPCTGPILATVATLVATKTSGSMVLWPTLVFVLGVTLPLYGLVLVGQRLLTRTRILAPYTKWLRKLLGVMMLLAAWMLATGFDAVIQAKLTGTYPVCSPLLNTFETNPAFLRALEAWQSH